MLKILNVALTTTSRLTCVGSYFALSSSILSTQCAAIKGAKSFFPKEKMAVAVMLITEMSMAQHALYVTL